MEELDLQKIFKGVDRDTFEKYLEIREPEISEFLDKYDFKSLYDFLIHDEELKRLQTHQYISLCYDYYRILIDLFKATEKPGQEILDKLKDETWG